MGTRGQQAARRRTPAVHHRGAERRRDRPDAVRSHHLSPRPPPLLPGRSGRREGAAGTAAWLGERLAAYAPRFAAEAHRDAGRLARHVTHAAGRLGWGGDVSLGFYLERPVYLSLALVTCAPNRANPDLACPLGG
ncbi:hypothetical protein [Streptomyces sennicomposti]